MLLLGLTITDGSFTKHTTTRRKNEIAGIGCASPKNTITSAKRRQQPTQSSELLSSTSPNASCPCPCCCCCLCLCHAHRGRLSCPSHPHRGSPAGLLGFLSYLLSQTARTGHSPSTSAGCRAKTHCAANCVANHEHKSTPPCMGAHNYGASWTMDITDMRRRAARSRNKTQHAQ